MPTPISPPANAKQSDNMRTGVRGKVTRFRLNPSARELSEPQRTALNAQLEKLTGKRLRMRFRVDEALIGGVVARIGSTVYDGSLRGQLASLESRLRAEA